MKITMYELLGMIKDGKASDIKTNFMFDGKKYNLLLFLSEYTLDINSLNWEIEIIEEKILLEKIKVKDFDKCIHDVTHKEKEFSLDIRELQIRYNELLDYLKGKGE